MVTVLNGHNRYNDLYESSLNFEELSRRKYGYKKSEHKAYRQFVSSYLPKVTYQRFKGGRCCVVG